MKNVELYVGNLMWRIVIWDSGNNNDIVEFGIRKCIFVGNYGIWNDNLEKGNVNRKE